MKSLVLFLFLVGFTCAEVDFSGNSAYGYFQKYGIPAAEKLRKAEEHLQQGDSRIVGGVPAALGQYEYQAGLIISLIGVQGSGICGASLITPSRLLTAAHCWFDGVNQGWRITVVLGSVTLFSGGTRIDTSVIAIHPNFIAAIARNDVGVIYLPAPVTTSSIIGPVALPTGSELNEDFAGSNAIASGFGIIGDGIPITINQSLMHVNLNVITNSVCSAGFPLLLQPSNICTSGIGGAGTCRGDSGGPLVVTRSGRRVLIGVTSFGSVLGCESFMPSVYARVTSFMPFITQHL